MVSGITTVFAALGAGNGDGVGVGELVEFGEVVVDLLVFVGEHGQGLLFQGEAGDAPTVPLKIPAWPLW